MNNVRAIVACLSIGVPFMWNRIAPVGQISTHFPHFEQVNVGQCFSIASIGQALSHLPQPIHLFVLFLTWKIFILLNSDNNAPIGQNVAH